MNNQDTLSGIGLSTKLTFASIFALLGFGASFLYVGHFGFSIFLLIPIVIFVSLPFYLNISIVHRVQTLQSDLLAIVNSNLHIRPLGSDEFGEIAKLINQVIDHRDAVRAEFEAHRLLDAVTGLPNRHHFLKMFDKKLESLGTHQVTTPSLAIIALDRFQRIQDTLGASVGDQILSEVANRLSKINGLEQISRINHREFAMLLTQASDLHSLTRFSETIRTWLEAPIPLRNGDQEIHLKVRIGITTSTDMTGLNAQEILRRGEAALHQAQSDLNRTLALFNADLDRKAREQIDLEKDLRRAIEAKEFMVAYQPIQNAKTGELAGFEALVRWKHPVKGMISPMAFIPLAEELGLIEELGSQILSEACKQLMDWSLKIPALIDTFISVNLSPKQFYDPLLLSKVWHAVQQSGMPYSRLKLEITESSIMDDPEDCSRRLKALHDLGIRLSLDDFGTGYSSFIHLDRFPVSTLKLDKSFVDKLLKDPQSPIVRSVATVAHVMSYELIAEGVEDSSQAECLKELGCGYIQGYLYAKPMFPNQFNEWYAKTASDALCQA